MKRKPGELRVIGGHWRSRRIRFAGDGVRPTPDRVRQTTFDWLTPWIHGSRCLDLCAGSGAMGLEALSRGADQVTLVERDARAAAAIRANLAAFGGEPAARGRVVFDDARHFLARPPAQAGIEIAFVDPPFEQGLWKDLLVALAPWLAQRHFIYLEWPGAVPPEWGVSLEWLKSSRAGQVSYGLARLTPTQSSEPT